MEVKEESGESVQFFSGQRVVLIKNLPIKDLEPGTVFGRGRREGPDQQPDDRRPGQLPGGSPASGGQQVKTFKT